MLPKNCLLAAIDLGSNSFRLEIDQYKAGYLRRKLYLREPVRLGRGLGEDLILSQAAMTRGWDYLAKIGHQLKKQHVHQARAIATQTLRQAKNKQEFIDKGEQLLGCPIEIISGVEEAVLIYTGVSALLDIKLIRQGKNSTENRLVVDIGGRSTEIIHGQGLNIHTPTSTEIGSVGLSMQFFENGQFTHHQFDDAIAYASSQLAPAIQTLKQTSPFFWNKAYGASGTIGAIGNVLRKNQISDGTINSEGLNWIYDHLIQAGHMERVHLPGLGDRKDVLGGGLSSLLALFSVINDLKNLLPARGALRQGILYDMIKSDPEFNAKQP